MRKTWAFREVGEGGQGSVGQIFDQAYLLLSYLILFLSYLVIFDQAYLLLSFTHTAPINNMHSFVFV